MKKNYALFKKRIFVLFTLICFALPELVFADQFTPSDWSVNMSNCSNIVTMRVGIYKDVNNNTNDDLWDAPTTLQMSYGGTTIALANFFSNHDGAIDYEPNGEDASITILGNRTMLVTSTDNTNTSGGQMWHVYFALLLTPSEIGQTINFEIVGTWQGGNAAGTKTITYNRTPNLASFSASDATNCSGVEVNWSAPSGVCPSTVIKFYRNGSYLVGQDQPYNSSPHLLPGGTPGVSYNYSARLSHLQGHENLGNASADNGTRKSTPDAPANFQASDDDCDTKINLTWDWNASSPSSFRIIKSGSPPIVVSGNVRSYVDNNVTRGVTYNYYVEASNNCGYGANSNSNTGISPSSPSKPADFNATTVPGVGIQLTWPATPNAVTYEIERSLLGGGGSSFLDPGGSLSYLDESLVQCQTYEYRLKAFNDCEPAGVQSDTIVSTRLVPDLLTTFDEPSNPLKASKGYFQDRVELTWAVANNENFIGQYKIYRKILGSPDDSIILQTINSGSNIHNDFLALPGVLYKYTIIAETQCEQSTIYSNVVSSIGFASPIGTISGQVSYAGGIAVKDVKMSANSASGPIGNALIFDGSSSLRVEHNNSLNTSNGLTMEMWFKPSSHASNFELVEKTGAFSLGHVGSNYTFALTAAGGSQSISIPDAFVSLNTYNQFTATLFNDTLSLYLNGISAGEAFLPGAGLVSSGTPLILANGYQGILDEFRLFTRGKSAASVLQDFSRQMNGGEADLKVYLKMNENAGKNAYDFSRTSLTNFNKNHAAFIGTPSWSADIPSTSQLSIASYTNAQGNYVLSIPYSGIGETFVITPSYLVHNFSPSTRVLFIGQGSAVFNNVDFLDISSFAVQGSLFFANTTCSSKDAVLYIDGNAVVSNGSVVKTDAQGNFLIQVPIGEHFITIEKPGHTMSVGRFPASGTYNFQNDLAGIGFIDSTVLKLVGRAVGGLKQASYIPGLGLSKNNIGVAELIIKSQQGNGCFTDTVYTDANTGEYFMYVPPLRYIPSVKIVSNPTIDFGVLNLLDMTDKLNDRILYDSTSISGVDSIIFNEQLDFVHRVNPNLVVKDVDFVSDFIGDTTYTYLHPNGDTISRNLRTNPLPWPVFDGVFNNKKYTCYISAFETYQNFDNPLLTVFDSVPTTDGDLNFNNALCVSPQFSFGMSDINSLDSLKYLEYTFDLSAPNFSQNSSIPEYSFVKAFQLNLSLPNGVTIPWKPDVFNGNGSPAFNAVYDQIFRAYVLGTKSDGQQFVTEGPQVPEYVLRDPPGSGSFASRESGSTKTTEKEWSYGLGGTRTSESNLYVGQNFSAGGFVAIETDILTDVSFGTETTISADRAGVETVSIANSQAWSTDSSPNMPGRNSDLYIGTSQNLTFGISETLKIVPDSMCTSVDCLVPTTNTDSFAMATTYGVSIVPEGYNTTFLYTEDFIKNQLIPDLIELRNALLTSDPKYNSLLPISDPNFGLNNDDPRITGDSVITSAKEIIEYKLDMYDTPFTNIILLGASLPYAETHYKSSPAQEARWALFGKYDGTDSLSLSGDSYVYNAVSLQDSLTGDSVRWINNQIRLWEESIMLNEWEKVNINNSTVRDHMMGVELTKLFNEYQDELIAYNALVAANLITSAALTAANFVPSPASGVALGIKSAIGISRLELYNRILEYQSKSQIIYDRYNQTPNNFSISSGVTFTSTNSHQTVKSVKTSIFMENNFEFATDLENRINNIGIGMRKGTRLTFETRNTVGSTNSTTESVSFTLNDPDQGDFFSVDVHPSLVGWGPVFKLRPGGKSSCPHEDAVLTEYYFEDPATPSANNPYAPNFALSERTQQRDKPTLDVAPFLLTNIPVTDQAVYNLTVGNSSESADTRTYKLGLVSSSNPFGAIVRVDGANVFADVTIGPNNSINKVLSVEKGPGPTYNYDSLLIVVYSECDPDIRDSAYVSAHFLPTCTEAEFSTPDDQWVLNNSFNDTMPIAVIDYNINFFDFNSIRLDYKPSSQPQWIGLQTFYRDTSGLNNPTAQEIPTNVPFTLWDWETDQIVDGAYDLRLVSRCSLVDKISNTHSGLMDRINPHPFGTPSPADGILDPNDDISIRFNEPIDLGSLTSLNFDVRGVINGSETTHASNLFFDGINDYVEVTGGAPLQQRDFTIEFSVKRGTLGEEPIITQGPDGDEQLYVGFNNNNQLECRINGQSVNSLNTYVDNDWHYFAVAYSYDNETAEIFEASATTTASIVNIGNIDMFEKYTGSDKLIIGKDLATGSHFTGNIDDVRIWNTARTLSEFSLTKSLQLSSNEPGLLYNWRFDEAEGLFAKDHVRSRDGIIFGAEWTIEPSGSALALDGVDDYLRVPKGEVNITQGMDFTLEFWFNSTQTGAASMISNGKGDGIGPDSLYAWNIAKDNLGNIHVYHNGEDFVATNNDYFDGEWHHLALVLNRTGNLTSYIDGNLEASVQATPYGELGGPAFYLGARGYFVGTVETTDNYFEGSIDEFRFWDASRKFEQIARDKQNRMLGDEFALRTYIPFEDYQLDPTGIPILTPSINEQVDPNVQVTNPNGALLTATTPKIKIQRPVESIAFTYSVNSDEIIITPTTNSALIENVTLDITVKNVKDLNGNMMESPKTWIAYMDKNQVVWQDDLLTFDKAFSAPLSFTSSISNEGGAAKNYTIENLPEWLTVSPTSGIIQPNSQLTINFEVDPNVNIGDYSQDIHLLTDFGFPEKLTIDLRVRENEPNWTVNPADFDFSMSIIGYLEIKDVVSTSEEDILAVFVDDECRGLVHLDYIPQLDRYLAFLDVYSNETDGEDLSFKIWDASSGTMFTEVDPLVIPFVENNVIGTLNNPQLFETNYEISFEIPVQAGWNWVSHFLYNVDSTDLDKTMESLESVTGDEIKTLTHGFSSYLNEAGLPVGWTGDINNQGIRPELGYKLKVASDDTLVWKGDILDPTSRTIQLTEGWNWIGFISIRNQSVTQALGNHNPTDGDLIKGKSQFAVYNTQLGWVGSLKTMLPGQGFMYLSADTVDFVYPFAGMFKSGNELEQDLYTNETWQVDDSPYAANMTGIIKINADCDYLVNNQNLTFGVFDTKGNARGVSPIDMNAFMGRTFATVAGDLDEQLTLNILDNNTKEVYPLDEVLTYASNTHLGSLEQPWEVNITEKTCLKMKTDAGILSSYFKVYPTVIESILNLDYIGRSQDSDSKARLYNVWGQKVWESQIDVAQGFNRIELDLSQLELAPGVYHFILDSNGATESVKLISK